MSRAPARSLTAPVRRLVALVLASTALGVGIVVRAQEGLLGHSTPGITAAEREAFEAAMQENFVKARDRATEIVRAHPDSFLGHHVLALAQHYGEANFPRALHEEKTALRLFATRYGDPPRPGSPWMFHAQMLMERSQIESELGMHEERLATLDLYDSLYQPKQVAERAWSLMKLGRMREARTIASAGLATDDPRQVEIALNAMCAIEFEAGNYDSSYAACRRALEFGRNRPLGPAVVDLTNFAEAARTQFELEESERVLLEATGLDDVGYGNPWLELGEIYLREARFPEAVSALREVPAYRARRPANMRESDRNESRRALASLYLLAGRADQAVRITDRALVQPDRRAHNSRDPAQDRAITALLDRAARLAMAEGKVEDALGRPWYERIQVAFATARMRFDAWESGRKALTYLEGDDRLVGLFEIGTSHSGVTPPWLVSDLASIAGSGVVRAAITRARRIDRRRHAPAYYDAFEAEAALEGGDLDDAIRLGKRALAALPRAESLLAARVDAVVAEAYRRDGAVGRAVPFYLAAFEHDPGVFRRLGLEVPVRVRSGGGGVADAVVDALERSPRFDVGDAGLRITVTASGSQGTVCLLGPSGERLGCGEARAKRGDDGDAVAARIVAAFHRAAFAPRVELSQTDISGLDGSNRAVRDPLESLFGPASGDGVPDDGL